MDYLSGLNASFLHVETAAAPMHAGSLMLLDVPNERRTAYLDALQRDVAARMAAVPLLTRKLQPVPFGLSNPVWDTDEHVDLDYHVRSHTLAGDGSMQALERLVATLHAVRLDRARPLWELHLVDGLAEGKLALFAKVHHAALDGIGASAILQALAGAVPGEAQAGDGTRARHGAAGPVSLLSSALTHAVGQAVGMARHVPGGLRSLATLRALPTSAPRTPFNATIGAARSVATLQLPLAELSLAARAYAGAVNDALLTIVGGALRRYLQEAGTAPESSLVAAVPASLRERGDGHLSSQLSVWRLELATGLDDAGARMRAVVANTHALRTRIAALRPLVLSDFPGIGAPWLMGGAALAAEQTRLADMLPPAANAIVSYVAGPAPAPQVAGAKVLAAYPVSIVAHGLALNISAQSCCDMLDIGIVAATSAVPDPQRVVGHLRDAHAELMAAAHALGAGRPAAPPGEAPAAQAGAALAAGAARHAASRRRASSKRG